MEPPERSTLGQYFSCHELAFLIDDNYFLAIGIVKAIIVLILVIQSLRTNYFRSIKKVNKYLLISFSIEEIISILHLVLANIIIPTFELEFTIVNNIANTLFFILELWEEVNFLIFVVVIFRLNTIPAYMLNTSVQQINEELNKSDNIRTAFILSFIIISTMQFIDALVFDYAQETFFTIWYASLLFTLNIIAAFIMIYGQIYLVRTFYQVQ